MSTYKIIRGYRDHDMRTTIKTGLTLEEAQAHCRDLETSSRTCQSPKGIMRTEDFGPWFDGYEGG